MNQKCLGLTIWWRWEHQKNIGGNVFQLDWRRYYSRGTKGLWFRPQIKDKKRTVSHAKGEPEIGNECKAANSTNEKHRLGVIEKYCVELAIRNARFSPASLLLARCSNHNHGISGIYGLTAARFLGLGFTNTSHFTTKADQVELQSKGRKDSKINAHIVQKSGRYSPLDAEELSVVYKLFAFGILMGIICGLFSESNTKTDGVSRENPIPNVVQAFIALFKTPVDGVMNSIKNVEPASPTKVLVNSKSEKIHVKIIEEGDRLPIIENQPEVIEPVATACVNDFQKH